MPSAPALLVATRTERFKLAGEFVISRGAKSHADVVVAEISAGGHTGRGECVPYRRYGETVESVIAAIDAYRLESIDREQLRRDMPAGAARNALDCALWDLAAKMTGVPAWKTARIHEMHDVATAYTLSLGSPLSMAEAARGAVAKPFLAGVRSPLLKLKLGGDGDSERIAAVRSTLPAARLIVDANEAWDEKNFAVNVEACRAAGVELIEQPLPAGEDEPLARAARPVPVCADESLHTAADLPGLQGKYDAVNIKLDKTGGLTEALDVVRQARGAGFKVMVGCMVGSSLGMAPALILAQDAEYVDLDGPLLLAADRVPGLVYKGPLIEPPEAALWG